jgi:FixJ family two-component response regulator
LKLRADRWVAGLAIGRCAAAKQVFASLAGLGRDIGAPAGNSDLLPASSTWAKFNVVLAAGPTGEKDQICRLIIESNARVHGSRDGEAALQFGRASLHLWACEGVLVTQRGLFRPIDAPETPVVLVIDDDPSLREALGRLFRSVDLESKLFPSVAELLLHKFPDAPCCVVLDIRLPGMSGLDFQTQLANSNIHVPIIMMTGHGDIPMSVRAMKGGAVDFLTKPFRDQDMLDAVAQAIGRDRERRGSEKARAELRERFESLTPREREIMALVTTGLMNKQVAGELGLSEITVKIHRGHIMRKMGVRSLADLVRAAEALELHQQAKSAPRTSG